MVEGRQVHRGAGRTAVHVELCLLQGEVARQVADVAFETIEHGRCHGIRCYPPGRDHCCGTCVDGSVANPALAAQLSLATYRLVPSAESRDGLLSTLVTPLTNHTQAVSSVVFSPDGHTLATASDDHTAQLWETDAQRGLARACDTAEPPIARTEWDRYFPGLTYQPPCPRR